MSTTVSSTEQFDNKWIKWVNSLLIIATAYAAAVLTIQLIPNLQEATKSEKIPSSIKRQDTNTFNPAKLSEQIAAAHLFGEAGEQTIIEKPTEAIDAPETRLNLVLAGVFSYQPKELAIAIISSGGRNEEIYGIGDKIVGNAILKAVFPDRVIIENRGREETLKLPEDVTPIALPRARTSAAIGNNNQNNALVDLPTTPKELRDKLVKNPSMLGKIVSATPYQEGGKLKGYRLQPKQNPEILEAQGIMANDVITQVNGIDLNSQKQGIRALRKLVKADSIELTILRDGIEVPVVISMDQ